MRGILAEQVGPLLDDINPLLPVPLGWNNPPIEGARFVYNQHRHAQVLNGPKLISFIDSHRPMPCISTGRSAAITDLYTPSLFTSLLIVTTYLLARLYFYQD